MKKLLFQFDTDAVPSVFDTVVGYDGGADRITGYGGVTPETVGALVDGTIYTRGGSEKKSTAIFVGGSGMTEGEALFKAVRKRFFGPFRVSCMLDSNGANTTAAAGVALVAKAAGSLQGKKAVILAGTGPVGMRSAALLAGEGAEVTIAGRALDRTQAAADAINARFKVRVLAAATPDEASRVALVKGTNLVFTAGAIGVELLPEAAWADEASIQFVADYNAQPPTGIGGIEAMDKARARHGKASFGALGIGGLKLKLHRACVGKLFDNTEQVFDAEEIYALARKMA
ncbi:NADP-dependent methylenetetrahydromethanopterin/methylenetetrahydrofolate dehydrogenase [uncultured Methylobacterium sp.]|uniref:NADP-dependent methylenetetrahydromethanopterin/methylenetetrahydrofolate dehydrogenase n=1 Tax=uncultured Methylobacterium sp. TaxID=157278 RepID=UPI0035CBF321